MSIVKKPADDSRARFRVQASDLTVYISCSPISPIMNEDADGFAETRATVKPLPSQVNRQRMPKKLMNAEQERFGADLHAIGLGNRSGRGCMGRP